MNKTIVPDVNILVITPSGPESWYTLPRNRCKELLKNFNPFCSVEASNNNSLRITKGKKTRYVQSKSRFIERVSEGSCFSLLKM